MASKDKDDDTEVIDWVQDSVDIIHTIIKWDVAITVGDPHYLVEKIRTIDPTFKEILQKLNSIHEVLNRHITAGPDDTRNQSLKGADAKIEASSGPKVDNSSKTSMPDTTAMGWILQSLNMVLNVTSGQSNYEELTDPETLADTPKQPRTSEKLKKIYVKLRTILSKWVSFRETDGAGNGPQQNKTVDESSKETGEKHQNKAGAGKEKPESTETNEISVTKKPDTESNVSKEKQRTEQLQKKIREVTEERDKYIMENNALQTRKPDTQSNISKEKQKIEQLQKKVREVTEERDKYIMENNALQTKLSEVFGAKLKDNNPAIADLSDGFRPTVIAEKYNQLYDDEWTDAFQVLSQSGLADTKNIQTLFDILKHCYEFCNKQSELQSEKIMAALISFESKKQYNNRTSSPKNLTSTERITLGELRRQTGHLSKETVINEYTEQYIMKEKKWNHDLLPFIEKCLELCWYMALQVPPVYLDVCEQVTEGCSFNKDLFKFYSRTGKTVAFVVWPPLFLHKDGPLLAKGVAEPKA